MLVESCWSCLTKTDYDESMMTTVDNVSYGIKIFDIDFDSQCKFVMFVDVYFWLIKIEDEWCWLIRGYTIRYWFK